ncbi:MAG: transposase [Promethearchaeota archaeon]
MAHIIISNTKLFLQGTFHGVSIKHLQRYLVEFIFRFNSRINEAQLFSKSILACSTSNPVYYVEIIV